MKKCDQCLRGTDISVTGVQPSSTLKINLGGAVVYIMPRGNGDVDVTVNSQNLIDGDYAACTFSDGRWLISSMKDKG